jgi:hypothetical protein
MIVLKMVREVFKRIPQANAVLQAAEAILKEGRRLKACAVGFMALMHINQLIKCVL